MATTPGDLLRYIVLALPALAILTQAFVSFGEEHKQIGQARFETAIESLVWSLVLLLIAGIVFGLKVAATANDPLVATGLLVLVVSFIGLTVAILLLDNQLPELQPERIDSPLHVVTASDLKVLLVAAASIGLFTEQYLTRPLTTLEVSSAALFVLVLGVTAVDPVTNGFKFVRNRQQVHKWCSNIEESTASIQSAYRSGHVRIDESKLSMRAQRLLAELAEHDRNRPAILLEETSERFTRLICVLEKLVHSFGRVQHHRERRKEAQSELDRLKDESLALEKELEETFNQLSIVNHELETGDMENHYERVEERRSLETERDEIRRELDRVEANVEYQQEQVRLTTQLLEREQEAKSRLVGIVDEYAVELEEALDAERSTFSILPKR